MVLHDPDRDAYPPSKWFSQYCMKQLMKTMHLGLYHAFLPDKPYYKPNGKTNYLSIPHGIYAPEPSDHNLLAKLAEEKANQYTLISILGNIRPEKNYELAIDALTSFPNLKLLIAGRTANSSVNTVSLKKQARSIGVENRIIWIEKFLSNAEMSAAIEKSDIILLNYAPTFTSQSGILNQVAPFKKKIIVSDTPNALSIIVKQYNLGILCKPDSIRSLVTAIEETLEFDSGVERWGNYIHYASWNNQTNSILNELKTMNLNS